MAIHNARVLDSANLDFAFSVAGETAGSDGSVGAAACPDRPERLEL
jgi:hypothetical protein